MTYDLRQGLTALGDAERAAAPALPVGTLLTRAHRKRMAHAATYSAIGVGAAAAVTIGAIAANGTLTDRDPVPPATEAPTSTPTQAPRATPTTTPTTPTEAAWAPNWDLCGMPAEDFYGRDTTGGVEAPSGWQVFDTWEAFETAYPVGEPVGIAVSASSWGMPEQAVEARVTDVVATGTDEQFQSTYVVGIAAGPTAAVTRGTVSEGQPLPVEPFTTSIVSCAASPLAGGDGALDTRLEEGTYHLEAVVDLATENGTVTVVTWLGYLGEMPAWDEPQQYVPGPAPTNIPEAARALSLDTPRRLGSDHVWNNTNTPMADLGIGCGLPPTVSDTTSYADRAVITGTAFLSGADLVARWIVTNTGPTINAGALLEYTGFVVVRDGVIVGTARNADPGFRTPDAWPSGTSVQVEMVVGPNTCWSVGNEPWPAGAYELYTWSSVMTSPADDYFGPSVIYGGPFTFTLE